MSEMMTPVCGSINGRKFTLQDFFAALKREAKLSEVCSLVLRRLVLDQLARDQELVISDETLQAQANQIRQQLGLHKAESTLRWMTEQRFEPSDFEAFVEARALEESLKQQFSDSVVQQTYQQIKSSFDRARLAHLVVASRGLAEELVMRVRDDGADFFQLVKEHSLDRENRDQGGYLGIVARDDMQAEVAEAVFGSNPGDVLGPFRINGEYHGIHVLELMPAEPNDEVLDRVRTVMLEEWVNETLAEATIHLDLMG